MLLVGHHSSPYSNRLLSVLIFLINQVPNVVHSLRGHLNDTNPITLPSTKMTTISRSSIQCLPQ
jgi:hypothetical protein